MVQAVATVRKRRARGTESAVINVWVDADVREYAAEKAGSQGVTLSLWLQQLIERERDSSARKGEHENAAA